VRQQWGIICKPRLEVFDSWIRHPMSQNLDMGHPGILSEIRPFPAACKAVPFQSNEVFRG